MDIEIINLMWNLSEEIAINDNKQQEYDNCLLYWNRPKALSLIRLSDFVVKYGIVQHSNRKPDQYSPLIQLHLFQIPCIEYFT